MSHSILITGASGYLGGSLLARLSRTTLPPYKKLYALVRSNEQAEAVKTYGAVPLFLDLQHRDAVLKSIVDASITVIYFLVDASTSKLQIPLIQALGEVKKRTGQEVHFLHTSGAKMFSEHVGFPTDRDIGDADPGLFEMQKAAKGRFPVMMQALAANNTVIETAEYCGVRSYVFIPCIVYGQGEGFGNNISIQTTAVVQAAQSAGAVYDVNLEGASWPVCHVQDNTALYVDLLRSILSGGSPEFGKQGYYLASSGQVAWIDIYAAMAKALAKRNVVESSDVKKADVEALEKMAKGLSCPKEFVTIQLGGMCTLVSERPSKIGWKAEYAPEHILEAADAEVELIIQHLKGR